MKTAEKNLPRYVYLYFLCQSINLMSAVISVAVAATVGELVSPDAIYSTIPYGIQFLFLLLGTYPAAILMRKKGRKFGFASGAFFLFCAGITGYIAVAQKIFLLLVCSHALIGFFTAFANYYRFAVTDNLPEALKSKALSLVVAGGVVAGILGPLISITLEDVAGFPRFSLCYGFLIVLAAINIILINFLPNNRESSDTIEKPIARKENLHANFYTAFLCAALCAAAGYGLMNLLMIQSSLQMNHTNIPFDRSAIAIQWHVVAMFFPSFFTGVLIKRMGHHTILAAGFLLFIASFLLNIFAVGYVAIMLSLVILGIAWNFSYVGGSALLTVITQDSPNKQKWQGGCDTGIALLATLGAMLPSILQNTMGWQTTNVVAISIAVIPLLLLAWMKVSRAQ